MEKNNDNSRKEKNKSEIDIFGRNFLNFNKLNDDFLSNDKLFKEDCYHIWPNEINNILSNTIDISIKDNIDIEKDNFNVEENKFTFQKCEKENDFCSKFIKNKYLYINSYGNNIENKYGNKYENEECSYMTHLTNLYCEYEQEKVINELTENKF